MGLWDHLFGRKADTVTAPAAEQPQAPDSAIRMADGPRDRGELMAAQGASGNAFFRGFLDTEEYNSDLKGTTGAKTYQKMRSDFQVEAVENIVTLPIKGASWEIEAYEKSDDPDENPLERIMVLPWGDGIPLTIVGIVDDVRDFGLATEHRPAFYLSFRQLPFTPTMLRLAVRTAGEPTALVPSTLYQLA